MNNITENQFYDLLALKLSGDASKDQLLLLQKHIQTNAHWQFLYDQMMQPNTAYPEMFTEQAFAAHIVKMQLEGKLNSINTNIEAPPTKSLYQKMLFATAIAASIITLVFFTFFAQDRNSHNINSINEVATKKGSKSYIKLPDGTEVWLNADSKLTYKENFGDDTREVSLNGEAYFDVFHDANHPFIIHTGKADVKVLGTAFNIKNYEQDKTIEATLIRGKIEVTLTDRPDEKIIIHPQEKIIILKERASTPEKLISKKTLTVSSVNMVVVTSPTFKDSLMAETSWMKDKMVFVNQPLDKIAQELERKFGVTILFKTGTVKQYRYTGVFEKESLSEILHIIQLSRKINYSIKDKVITIE